MIKNFKWMVLASLALAACSDDDNGNNTTDNEPITSGSADLSRYVALGDSFAAGYSDNALFKAGHLPMIGEWVALPVWYAAGGKSVGDDLYEEIFHPTAGRLLQLCEGVLRLPGESKGADNDVRIARERGIPVWYRLEDVPGCA